MIGFTKSIVVSVLAPHLRSWFRTAQWPGFFILRMDIPADAYVNLLVCCSAADNYSAHPNWVVSLSVLGGTCWFNLETWNRDFLGTILSVTWLSELRAGDVQKSVSCLPLPQGFSPLFHRPRVFIADSWVATATLSMVKMWPYTFFPFALM